MLSLAQNNSQIVSKIFTDQMGRQFELTFLITIVDGALRGRLLSARPLPCPSLKIEGEVAAEFMPCLPIICPEAIHDTAYVSTYAPVKSPYYSVEFLLNTQPARAPSRK